MGPARVARGLIDCGRVDVEPENRMCGIAGVWSFAGGAQEDLHASATAMADAMRHRGPDDGGSWVDAAAGVAFGFRRLAIIDLSSAGAQPMVSPSGRYVIVFNGEVYNFGRLREELHVSLRGHSDTEVVLACIDAWGLDAAVRRFIGMFAFALWDREERRLSLVRDRVGVKPLHYRATAGGVSFASELKSLKHEGIDRAAVALYARYGYVPAPYSIFAGTRKVMPGTIVTFDADGTFSERPYWDVAEVAERAASNRFQGSDDDAIEAVDELLRDAVRLRLIADVPLGVFLSGGIDSPLIAAMMMREAGHASTFTIGFEGMESEAPRAAAIAKALGTRHTEWVISGRDVLDTVPLMATLYDEPLGDSSSIPTYLVSRLAREHVTVALSGDGGDEFFAGYHRYFLGRRLDQHVARVPRRMRRVTGLALKQAAYFTRRSNLRDRLRGLGAALVLDDPIARFQTEVASGLLRVKNAGDAEVPLTARGEWPHIDDPIELTMYLDAISFLPDDLLVKVDRASMAVSLEVREPLLDHRLIELAWSLPLSTKIRGTSGKWILRRLLNRYLPVEMVDGEKRGFGLPIDSWLHGPLREWAGSLIDAKRIEAEGWFDARSIRRVWNHGPVPGAEQMLWRVLMFQQWLAVNG